MNTVKYFTYCHESGFDTHETIEGAIEDANERIPNYLDEGWSEDVTSVCVGEITHMAKMCDQVFPDGEIDEDGFDESGWLWDPDWEYKCNYKMLPVEQNPAPDVSMLVGVLEEMIDVAKAVDSWESFPSAPIDRAQDALTTYRKQGGSK